MYRPPPFATLALILALPAFALVGYLYVQEQSVYAVFEPRLAGLSLLSVLLSLGVGLAPLAVLPLRTRTYGALAAAGLAPLLSLNLVHVVEYHEMISLGAVDAIVSTTWHEAMEFASARRSTVLASFGLAVALAFVYAALVRLIPREHKPTGLQRAVFAGAGVLTLAVLLGMNDPPRVFPLSTVKNTYDLVQQRRAYRALRAERADFSFRASMRESAADRQTMVIVIGESLRRRQLPLYGYPRNTMPRTGAREWLVFSDAVSTTSQTQYSVKAMLTAAGPESVVQHAEKSVLTLAREIGYETFWLSNQDRTFDTEVALVADEADHTVYTNHSWSAERRYDEALIPHFERALASSAPRKLIVLHLAGSHERYSRRYPPGHAYFSGTDRPRPSNQARLSPSQRATIDHYDDSVRYTDYVLDLILRRLEEEHALVMFVSDHGEHLYDPPRELVGHGMPTLGIEEVEVPLLLWGAAPHRARYPEVWRLMERNRHTPMSTANLFFGLADLLGAEFDGMVPEHSFVRSEYAPRPRTVLTVHGTVEPLPGERHPMRAAGGPEGEGRSRPGD